MHALKFLLKYTLSNLCHNVPVLTILESRFCVLALARSIFCVREWNRLCMCLDWTWPGVGCVRHGQFHRWHTFTRLLHVTWHTTHHISNSHVKTAARNKKSGIKKESGLNKLFFFSFFLFFFSFLFFFFLFYFFFFLLVVGLFVFMFATCCGGLIYICIFF